MIRQICILMIALIIVLAVCIVSQWYIKNSTREICESLRPVETAIANEDWVTAQKSFNAAKTIWEKTSRVWRVLIDHEDMRDIEISFVDMEAVLRQQNRIQAEKEFDNLFFYISHVIENEKLDLQNLF